MKSSDKRKRATLKTVINGTFVTINYWTEE